MKISEEEWAPAGSPLHVLHGQIYPLQHKTFKPVFEPFHIEIDEKTLPDASQFHVGEQLGFVDAKQTFHALKFQKNLMVNQHIDAVTTIQPKTFVFDRQGMLCQKGNALELEFVGEALLVGRFQQPRPQIAVHFNRTADHTVG